LRRFICKPHELAGSPCALFCETIYMSRILPALLFDLDGTLTDSKPGIVGCLRKVLEARQISNYGLLDRFVGPPVEEWAVALLPQGSEEERLALVNDYRACYNREGWSNNSVFPGVAEVLTELRLRGFPLYVCTSKQSHFAVRILEKFEIARFFDAVYGDQPEFSSHSKVDLLKQLLAERKLDRETTWMVGDRIYDIDAAHKNAINCLAAAWGYGSPEEWAQADALAATPAAVLAFAATLATSSQAPGK
jgi:phosphoglycolate phosphatase